MANLRFTLTVIAVGLVLAALALSWFAPVIISWVPDQVDAPHLFLAAFVFVGLCGVAFYSMMERALNPVLSIVDAFTRMRAGDLHPRLPVEGPEEMRRMALGFNDMVEDLETQVRDIEVEKQDAERARGFLQEQLNAVAKFRSLADSAPLGLILADKDLRVVYQNDTSESVLFQLNECLSIDPSSLIGERVSVLYPDPDDAAEALTNPDHLPYESSFEMGLLAEVEDLELMEEDTHLFEDAGFELIDEPLDEDAPVAQNGSHSAIVQGDVEELKRGASLVTRSVRVLSERLSSVRSSIQALSSEGDGLRRSIDEIRQQVERTGDLATERAESLWDLVGGAREATSYGEMVREAAARLRGRLNESETMSQSITRLQSSIDHLVLSAKVELGRADEPAGGLRAVVEAISDLSPEVARLQREIEERVVHVRQDLDEMTAHLDGSGWSARQTGRLSKRGGDALDRLAKDVEETTSQGRLLIELADGQAEIRGHIQRQIEELYELVQVTQKVALEQESIVERADVRDEADSKLSE